MNLSYFREEFSKWLMRTQQAGRVLRLPLFFITALSTTITALRGTFLESYTFLIAGAFCVAAMVFIWAYDRFQVLNIQNRWNADRSNNYAGPGIAMNQMINAVQLGVLSQSIQGGWSDEKTREHMLDETRKAVSQYRNGIDMSEFE